MDCPSLDSWFYFFYLKLYAQSATTGPFSATQHISDAYTAVAASWIEVSKDLLQSDFVKAWLHIILVLFPLSTWLVLYLCDPVQLLLGDKTWTMLEDEHAHSTLAAMIQIAVIFTTLVFIMDIIGIYFTVTSNLITYNVNTAFYLSTVTGLVIDVGAFVWVLIVLVTSSQWDCIKFLNCLKTVDQSKSSVRAKKYFSTVTVAHVTCALSS